MKKELLKRIEKFSLVILLTLSSMALSIWGMPLIYSDVSEQLMTGRLGFILVLMAGGVIYYSARKIFSYQQVH